MTRTKKVALAFTLLIAGLTTFVLLNNELRTFLLIKIAPAQARDGLLRRFEKTDSPDIYLLGTIHGAHLETEHFSLAHLEAVLVHLRPTRLLVESRPAEVAAGNLCDGPIEMGYVSLIARAKGIPFDGIDWWDEDNTSARRTDATRDDRIAQNLFDKLPDSGTALVLVGFSHVSELAQRLGDRGYNERPIPDQTRTELFDTSGIPTQFPAGMIVALELRIARDNARIADNENSEMAQRIGNAVKARQDLLRRVRRVGER